MPCLGACKQHKNRKSNHSEDAEGVHLPGEQVVHFCREQLASSGHPAAGPTGDAVP